MTRREFLSWIEVYRRWPFDDLHRYHRPAALIAHSVAGEPTDKLIEYLQPKPTPAHDTLSDVDTRLLKQFGISCG